VIAAVIAFVVLLFFVAFFGPVARSAYPILAKNLPTLVPHQPLTLS
jgi:hypothetical protein